MTSLPPRILTAGNVSEALRLYRESAEMVGNSIAGLKGLRLLEALKRGQTGSGPYPDVSLFEAANRIMTDLVILHGVKWLLEHEAFPFREYSVAYGHGDDCPHDIEANQEGVRLIGEAFNVAPSFFSVKKSSVLKKLRRSAARYRLIACNIEAAGSEFTPRLNEAEFLVQVDTGTGVCRLIPGVGGLSSSA